MQATIMKPPGAQELRRLGATVAASGDLARLRAKMRITKNTMARFLDVSIGALADYEIAKRAITGDVALRIGEWYWCAIAALEDAIASGVPLHTLVPSAQAAQYLGRSLHQVEDECRIGIVRGENLGVLGWYVYPETLPAPRSPEQREQRRLDDKRRRDLKTPEQREQRRENDRRKRALKRSARTGQP